MNKKLLLAVLFLLAAIAFTAGIYARLGWEDFGAAPNQKISEMPTTSTLLNSDLFPLKTVVNGTATNTAVTFGNFVNSIRNVGNISATSISVTSSFALLQQPQSRVLVTEYNGVVTTSAPLFYTSSSQTLGVTNFVSTGTTSTWLGFTTASGTTLNGITLNFGTATGSTVNALSATFATATISGVGVCLASGVNCPASSGGGNANFWKYDDTSDYLYPVTSTTGVSSTKILATSVTSSVVTTTALWAQQIISNSNLSVSTTGNVDFQIPRSGSSYFNVDASDIYLYAYSNGLIDLDTDYGIQLSAGNASLWYDEDFFGPRINTSNNLIDLGTGVFSWRSVAVSSTSFFGGPLIPRIGATPTLGSPTSSWGSIYASNTSQIAYVSSSGVTVNGVAVCLADGTNCPAGSGIPTLAQVTAMGASATATLQLYGGFLASSSTVTSTFTVVGSTGLQAVTFTNATGSQVTSTSLYVSGSASTTRLFANSATIGTATLGTSTVEGKGICLSDGSYCSPSGSEADTLATVTGRGSSTIQTLNLMGGFIAASSSVTSTFNVTGATTLANATATSLFTTTLKGTSSTITTIAATNLFGDGTTSTALFATSFKATSSTIATLAAGTFFYGNATGTNLFGTVVSSTNLFANMGTLGGLMVSGTTVCLSTGVGCLAASASAAGIVELATIAETSAGTDATRAVTPDGLSGSVFGSRIVELYLPTSTGALLAVNSASNTSTCFTVQPPLAGMVLTAAHVAHGVAGSGTTSTVVNIKTTSSLFLLSTPLYIDPGEYGSDTAVTSSVINTSNDDVFAYQRLCADVQNVENTTPGKETILSMTFSLP